MIWTYAKPKCVTWVKYTLYYPLIVCLLYSFPIFPSYFTECDLKIEVLENINPESITQPDSLNFIYLQMKIKILSENSCHANDLKEILLGDFPYSNINSIKKGTKILVRYSYANFDPLPDEQMSEIIGWKFIRIIHDNGR